MITGDRLRALAGAGGRFKLAGVVVSKQERVTERTRLVRLIVSDAAAQFEITAFSELMGQARELLDGTAPLYFEVDARVDGDILRLTAQRIQKLDDVVDMARSAVEITLAAPNVARGSRRCCSGSPPTAPGCAWWYRCPAPRTRFWHCRTDFVLASGQRLDVERLAGVVAVRDVAVLN